MPRDYSRSWKHHLELGHLEKKSHFSDDEQVTKAMAYLEEAASSNCPSFYNNNKEVRCHCHASLCTNEDYRNAVAIHVLWWARLDKETQQTLLMETNGEDQSGQALEQGGQRLKSIFFTLHDRDF